MTTGRLHTGPEPDWSFTDDIRVVDLQLNDPMASRLIYVLESDGRLFIISVSYTHLTLPTSDLV